MNNFYISFSVVFPLFCMMSLGYILKNVKIFNDDFLRQLNNLCFKIFLPLLLFMNVYNSDFKSDFSGGFILFAVICTLIIFAILMIVVPLFQKDNLKRGVMIQSIFRSNFVLFGIHVTASLFGDKNISITSILMAFIIPLFNLLSVIALEIFSNKKVHITKILIGIMKNPLIIASLFAFFFVFTEIKLPTIFESIITDISKIGTPLALIVLGGSFAFKGLNHDIRSLTFSVVCKLIILPLIFVPISIFMGYRDVELATLFVMFASPSAVSTYTMAQNANADSILAGQIVVINSIVSILTIFIGITLLRQFSLI